MQGTPLEPINWEAPKIDDIDLRNAPILGRTQKWLARLRGGDQITTTPSTPTTTKGLATPLVQVTPTSIINIFDLSGTLVGGGDGDPLNKHVEILPTCCGGSLPSNDLTRDNEPPKQPDDT